MRIHQAILPALLAVAMTAQAQEPSFTYHCTGFSKILPTGLALGKIDWTFEIQPGKKAAVVGGKPTPMEINEYRVSFPMQGNHWMSITRSNGHFYAVQPIENPERKMQEYLLYEGECKS